MGKLSTSLRKIKSFSNSYILYSRLKSGSPSSNLIVSSAKFAPPAAKHCVKATWRTLTSVINGTTFLSHEFSFGHVGWGEVDLFMRRCVDAWMRECKLEAGGHIAN